MNVKESEPTVGSVEVLFRLDSVEPAVAPDGSDGVWYRYKIVQGTNIITGMRLGTLAESNVVLREMVERLNERAGAQRAKHRK